MDDTHLQALNAAAAAYKSAVAAQIAARDHLHAVVRDVAPYLRQAEIVRRTGWTREHIRKIVKNE